ncbi:MAG: SDR family NAD(P)-dependent oxidoreductase, partial [Anaerolineales bacterium]|nr:SDR family NAD(P)-dependent oxidoreductase [Anaerolineales bacterium]
MECMTEKNGRFANKVIIVTGAGKGIGQAIAARFAREGGRVVVNDVVEGAGETAVSAITQQG